MFSQLVDRHVSWRRFFDWRRVVVYSHRWLGIFGCVLFVAWFASGIVMMYARMPRLDPQARRATLPVLDLSRLRVSPADAARAATATPQRILVGMQAGRPAYRLLTQGRWTTIFGDDGRLMGGLSEEEAIAEVRRFAPGGITSIRYDAHLRGPDQWTLESRGLLPMHRIALGDTADTYFYLSDQTGQAVLRTTRSERRWAYAGAVIHWIYFTPFRQQSVLWAQSIIWLSLTGSVMCLLGLLWGAWRLSPIARYRLKRVASRSPYAGSMRWHHYAGLFFGVTTFTWVFSGLLSMDPWEWHPSTSPTRAQREPFSGGPLRLDQATAADVQAAFARLQSSAATELEILQFKGETFLTDHERLVRLTAPDRARFAEFDRASLLSTARDAMPAVSIDDATWLDRYDAYYYDRDNELPLPILRVRFHDTPRTWLYVDPRRGAVVRKEERLSRVNRWLYHGLHSLDFPFLYYRRPLWDILVILLSLGGLASAITSVVPATRRLRRHWRRIAAWARRG